MTRGVLGAVSVLPLRTAPTTELRLDGHMELAAVGMRTTDEGAADRGIMAGSQAIGQMRRQCLPDDIERPDADFIIEPHRRWILGIEHRALVTEQLQRSEGAGIGWCLRTGDRLE